MEISFESPRWCNYDQIYKIAWTINGRKTNAFSTRNKRIGEKVPQNVQQKEYMEAVIRLQVVKDYLEGNITRETATETLLNLKELSPRRPTHHLLTMTEIALGLR